MVGRGLTAGRVVGHDVHVITRRLAKDPTLWAIPGYFAAMAVERRWYRRHPDKATGPGGYERRDTRTSLAMGDLSVVAPMVLPALLAPLARRRVARYVLGAAAAAAASAAIADRYVERRRVAPSGEAIDDRALRTAEAVRRVAGPAAVAATGMTTAVWLSSRTRADDMFAKRLLPDLGGGLLGFGVAMVGWDFLYYWSHRLQHELRYLWAVHVVHHSSERYNLSTALRQPVAESFGTMMPYGTLGLLGVRPDMILLARGVNLIWQFWIHTEVVRSLGVGEEVLSTPSAHRVHHGSNRQYLDRNHGGILIVWDRLFGTFEREGETVVYGLTTNIETFNPWVVATHEYRAMFADVAQSSSWRERLGHVVGPPGWRPTVPELAVG
jgi:sterol desaturase/sphingolipid hydroxylase (fatty acid hydroxylase superfamily)